MAGARERGTPVLDAEWKGEQLSFFNLAEILSH